TRMKITAYNQHDVGSSHEPWSSSSHTNLLATSQRRYAIKRSEGPMQFHGALSPVPVGKVLVVNPRESAQIRGERILI
ncbi:MAG: hypothetical protein WBF04_23095, partial [Candidatus Sulfotelmatobacter sp.]